VKPETVVRWHRNGFALCWSRLSRKGRPGRPAMDHEIRELIRYVSYYHRARTHLSLDKDAPEPSSVQPPDRGTVIDLPEVGGLHHGCERRAA
jgi:hypothetical protein